MVVRVQVGVWFLGFDQQGLAFWGQRDKGWVVVVGECLWVWGGGRVYGYGLGSYNFRVFATYAVTSDAPTRGHFQYDGECVVPEETHLFSFPCPWLVQKCLFCPIVFWLFRRVVFVFVFLFCLQTIFLYSLSFSILQPLSLSLYCLISSSVLSCRVLSCLVLSRVHFSCLVLHFRVLYYQPKPLNERDPNLEP